MDLRTGRTIYPAAVLRVERIEGDGWTRYRDLRLAALGDAPAAFGSRLETERARDEDEWRERLASRVQFVALLDGRDVGTVGARPRSDGTTELVSMWVAPSARRRGVAGRLVATVTEEARSRGSDAVVLWVCRGNETAERLYARHGFERTGAMQPIDDAEPTRDTEFEMRLATSC